MNSQAFCSNLQTFLKNTASLTDNLEMMHFFHRAVIASRIGNETNTLHLSLKPEWHTAHLARMDMEARLILQTQQSGVYPGLLNNTAEFEEEIKKLVATSPGQAEAIIKLLILSNLRLAQWTSIVAPVLEDGLSQVEEVYNHCTEEVKEEMNSRVRLLTSKVDRLDKLLKSIQSLGKTQLTAGKASMGEKDTKKLEKELEKLRVKVIALEKQNGYLVSREKEIEGKLKDFKEKGEKKKKKTSSAESEPKEIKKLKPKEGLMIFDSPAPAYLASKAEGGKTSSQSLSVKQEKLDKLESTLLEYTQLLSTSLFCVNKIPEVFFEEKTYIQTLELIIESLPKIEKRKLLLNDKSEWLRCMLELGVRLIDNHKRVKFSAEQELVGVYEVLPLHFTPKTTYWMNVVKTKGNEILHEENTGFGKLVPNDAITRKINELLTIFVNYLRSKIAETNEKLAQYKTPTPDPSQPFVFNGPNQGLEIRNQVKKIRTLIISKAMLCKTMIACYLFSDRCSNIGEDRKIYFKEEIEELLGEKQWQDFPSVGSDIRKWFESFSF